MKKKISICVDCANCASKIEEAARKAQLGDFIDTLPDRYDTVVGERGARLSGGQRQSLTLLMATYNVPKLLLLDEHTAALDPATAEKVLSITRDVVEKNNITYVCAS